MKVMVTGGCGFIGVSFVRLLAARRPGDRIINVDKLTYAGNPLSLADVAEQPNYELVRADIADAAALEAVFERHRPELVVHLAAESHVDRSIVGPRDFIDTNINGTFNLLEACRRHWSDGEGLFHHVSTDEVFGSLGPSGRFVEESRYDPSSPYSASKAAGDHLARAYHRTYGLPLKVTNCSNNYGPYQFPEKLIPLMILNALERKPLPLYGSGTNVRDWLYVEDHCEALLAVIERGRLGETYNIGGATELTNSEVVDRICRVVADETDADAEELRALVQHVPDRPGHDQRYAIDAAKIRRHLGWEPRESFDSGLRKTVRWYLDNGLWIDQVRTGEYRRWIEAHYGPSG